MQNFRLRAGGFLRGVTAGPLKKDLAAKVWSRISNEDHELLPLGNNTDVLPKHRVTGHVPPTSPLSRHVLTYLPTLTLGSVSALCTLKKFVFSLEC